MCVKNISWDARAKSPFTVVFDKQLEVKIDDENVFQVPILKQTSSPIGNKEERKRRKWALLAVPVLEAFLQLARIWTKTLIG